MEKTPSLSLVWTKRHVALIAEGSHQATMKEDSLRIKKMRAKIIEKEYIQVLDRSFIHIFPLSFPQIFPLLNFSLFLSLTSFKPSSNLIYSLKLSLTSPGKVCGSVCALLAPENPVIYPLDILGDKIHGFSCSPQILKVHHLHWLLILLSHKFDSSQLCSPYRGGTGGR